MLTFVFENSLGIQLLVGYLLSWRDFPRVQQ